jgi:hypothetical protein
MTTTVLLDTAKLEDALACGYESAIDPRTSGSDGLLIELFLSTEPPVSVELHDGRGSISLVGRAEIQEAIRALQLALHRSRPHTAETTSFAPKEPTQ